MCKMIYVQSSLLVVAKELDILYPSKKAIVKYIIYIHIETYFVDIEEMKKFILWHWKKSPQIMKYKRLGDMAITGVTNPFLFVFETWSIDRNWFLVLLKKKMQSKAQSWEALGNPLLVFCSTVMLPNVLLNIYISTYSTVWLSVLGRELLLQWAADRQGFKTVKVLWISDLSSQQDSKIQF